MSVPTKDFFEFGSFTVDAVERVLLRNNQPVALTQKVFDLLLVLVRNSGHVVDKEKLMREIWPDSFVEEGNLTQNISLLRKVLNGDGHQYIQTVPRRGYRFVGHVRELGVESSLLIEEHSLARLVVEETHLDHVHRESSAVVDLAVAPTTARPAAALEKTGVDCRGYSRRLRCLGIAWSIFGFRNVASSNPPPFDVNNVTLRTITSTGNIVYGLISSDGQFVAYCTLDEDNRYALWLQHAGSKDALRLVAPAEGSVGPVAISHDNNWIYYGQVKPNDRLGGVTIYRMPLLGGPPRKVIEASSGIRRALADDQRILLHRFKDGGGIDVISVNALDGGDERLLATSDRASDYLGTRWSPDGSKLLFFRMEQRADGTFWSLNEMPAQGGPIKAILPPAQRRIWFVDWADQGRGIVMNATDPVTKMPQLYYVSYPLGETRRITNDLVGYTTISVGGETIMAGKVERQSKVWVTNWPAPNRAGKLLREIWRTDLHGRRMLALFMTQTTMAESIFGAQTLMAVSANKCLRTTRTNDNRMFLPTEN
jgi:DNA-binding winged helix-turn-helix (wHTH) protein/Tol biopolymer transport system component